MLSTMGDTTDSLASLMAKTLDDPLGRDKLTLESAEGEEEGEGGGKSKGEGRGGVSEAGSMLTEEQQAQVGLDNSF